jgi:hypothetical protein
MEKLPNQSTPTSHSNDAQPVASKPIKSSVKRRVRNIVISIFVMLFLTIGLGVGYTWFMGINSKVETATVAGADTSTAIIKHVTPAANVPESASIQTLTSPIAPGDNASVTIKTNPTSVCTISVIYNTTASTDSGLKDKTADEFGIITWSWTVDSKAPVGKWPVKVTCSREKLSAVVIGDLVVSKTPIAN